MVKEFKVRRRASVLVLGLFVVFMGVSLPCFADYQPDVKVTFSLDGQTFREGMSKDLRVGEPVYLQLECSVKRGGIHSLLGVSSIECGVSFRDPRIIDVEPDENTVSVRLMEEIQPMIGYAFRIPATNDGQRKIRVIFRCVPKKSGTQEIRVAFDDHVDSNVYQMNFRLKVN